MRAVRAVAWRAQRLDWEGGIWETTCRPCRVPTVHRKSMTCHMQHHSPLSIWSSWSGESLFKQREIKLQQQTPIASHTPQIPAFLPSNYTIMPPGNVTLKTELPVLSFPDEVKHAECASVPPGAVTGKDCAPACGVFIALLTFTYCTSCSVITAPLERSLTAATAARRVDRPAAWGSHHEYLSNMKLFSHPYKHTQFIDHKNNRPAPPLRIVMLHSCRKHGGLLEGHFGMRALIAFRALGVLGARDMRVVRREIAGRAEENPAMRTPNAPDARRDRNDPHRHVSPIHSNSRPESRPPQSNSRFCGRLVP